MTSQFEVTNGPLNEILEAYENAAPERRPILLTLLSIAFDALEAPTHGIITGGLLQAAQALTLAETITDKTLASMQTDAIAGLLEDLARYTRALAPDTVQEAQE